MNKSVKTMSEDAGTVALLKAEMGPDMDARYVDKALYYTMLDAIEAKDALELVGRNVFRPETARPAVDDFIMDEEVVVEILEKLGRPKLV